MEVDVIHGKHEGLIFRSWSLVAPMTLEREVIPTHKLLISKSLDISESEKDTNCESLSSTYLGADAVSVNGSVVGNGKWVKTYWMATRPSTLPIAKPVPLGKQDITRVCHFNGDIIV